MLFVDGNMKLLDSDNHHDLCQMILNNLTLIKKNGGGSSSGGHQNMLNGGNSQMSIDGGGSIEGGDVNLDREQTLYSAKLAISMANVMKQNEPAKLKISDSALAVEHKIFFNEHYKNEYERNRVIITKNDKRKKGLLMDKEMSTEFEKAIVYEAFDTIYAETVPLSNSGSQATSVTTQIAVNLIKGRMSEHMILQLHIQSVT